MPGEVEIIGNLVVELLQTELRPDLVERAPVQDVEFDEGLTPGAHLFHARLIQGPPSVGKGEPIDLVTKRLQNPLGIARDAVPPIDAGAEHIVDERPDPVRCRARLRLRQYVRRSEPPTRNKRACRRNRRRILEKAPARDVRHRLLPLGRLESGAIRVDYTGETGGGSDRFCKTAIWFSIPTARDGNTLGD